MSASRDPHPGLVRLPSAGLPADLGLASLGLVMQLAGYVTGALAALVASIVASAVASAGLLESGMHRNAGWFCFAIALCVARSQLHLLAGRDLLYSRRTVTGQIANPFDAMRTYIAFGLGHAIVIGLVATTQFGATGRTAAGIAAALALWPVVLGGVSLLPRLRPLRGGLPLGEDRGLEGASILMAVLAVCGVLSTGAIVLVLGELSTRHLQHGWGVMLVVVFAVLLVRSCLHLRVALIGLRETSFDRPGELASRYASFGIVSSVCVAGVLVLLAMSERLAPEAVASVAVVGWLLATWPMIVKRYFHHRQFAELLAGDRVLHQRPPDAGLTGLGWLLAGHAILVTSLLLVAVTTEPGGVGHVLGDLTSLIGPILGPSKLDLALTSGVCVLEIFAAAALLRMTERCRVIAKTYAMFGSGVALAMAGPLVRALGDRHLDHQLVIQWIPTAIQIVIPVATLILVHREVAPVAQARYRVPIGPARSR